MTAFEYGTELIKKLDDELAKVTKQIEALEVEQSKLKENLAKNTNNYDVKTVKANHSIQQELNTIENALNQAKKHRESLIVDNTMTNFEEATRIIQEVKQTEKNAKADNVKQIQQKIVEIYELYDDAKEYDDKVDAGIDNFIEAMTPYFSDKDLFAGGLSTAQQRLTLQSARPDRHNGMKVIDFFKQGDYFIEGLAPAPSKQHRLTLDK